MAEYAGRLPLFHQDLYRLSGAEEALGSGMLDERQTAGVTLIEWAERLDRLDPDALVVTFHLLPDERRRIEIIARAPGHTRYVDALRSWTDQTR
jgi:tRNA threonylcarbamoyladenosine biosynthesis protein TsaE